MIRVKKLNKSSSCWVHYTRVSWTETHSLSFLTLITKLRSFSAFCNIPQPSCTQIVGKGVAKGPFIPMNSYLPDPKEKLSLYCPFTGLFLTLVMQLTKVTSDNQWNSSLVLVKATTSREWEEGTKRGLGSRMFSQLAKRSLIVVISG